MDIHGWPEPATPRELGFWFELFGDPPVGHAGPDEAEAAYGRPLTKRERRFWERNERLSQENEQRRLSRVRATPPYRWGRKLNATHYFCWACWHSGFESGAHPYNEPPCDPVRPFGEW